MERLNIDIFNEIDSTNDEAKRINLNKEFHIIIAEKQYKGRGRLGKKWSSPDLGNIYMTVCTEKDFSYIPLSLVIGVICKKGIEKFINNNDIELKWPNDILYNNKKVGGILVEKEVIKESTRTIIGIGINLNIKKEESWWGDLSKYELETKRNKLINLIISEIIKLDRHYDWIDTWRNGCAHLNKEVEIYKDEEFIKMIHYVKKVSLTENIPDNLNEIIFGAGCFWGVEKKFWDMPGIYLTSVGYSGGDTENPSYEDICYKDTNHVEVVKINYDAKIIKLDEILKVFWECHDPTQGMRQGNDIGTQYRSVIFCSNEDDMEIANKSKDIFQEILNDNNFDQITTEISKVKNFYQAEEYHQQYLAKNPNGYCGIGGTGCKFNS